LREAASVDRLRDVAGPVTDPRAHDLRRRYGELFSGSLVPVPVEAIAEDYLGLRVVEAELDGVSGLLYPAERTAVLNAQEPATRRRFTLAHELGHWVCQCLEGTEAPVFCRAEEVGLDPAVKALEREANVFAAELLMPEDELRAAWDGDPDASATHFGVSGEAMRWRLYSFGLGEPPS
jgi:Zn-dependent peptidase ImmA (M78 family)